MNRKLLLLTFLTFTLNFAYAQTPVLQQYFDGADTLASNSLIIHIDTAADNLWQVGPPQKTVFDTAATVPNVIVTDTINTYPNSNTSVFTVGFYGQALTWGIIAFRWMQKLDMDFKKDGGYVEYSVDTGTTWINVLRDTNVYNFYGYDTTNLDTLANGTVAFTGTDTTWRDVWVCYQTSFFNNIDSVIFRFTFESDTVDSAKDGWMIDNMLLQETFFHTVSTTDPDKEFMVYPTITTGEIKVDIDNANGRIENVIVVDQQGRVMKRFNERSEKMTIDIGGLPPGNYYINVHSDKKIEVHKVLLSY